MEASAFLDLVGQSCSAATDSFIEEKWQKFAALLGYFDIDATDEKADWDAVKTALSRCTTAFLPRRCARLYVPICGYGPSRRKMPARVWCWKNPLGQICKVPMRLIRVSVRF